MRSRTACLSRAHTRSWRLAVPQQLPCLPNRPALEYSLELDLPDAAIEREIRAATALQDQAFQPCEMASADLSRSRFAVFETPKSTFSRLPISMLMEDGVALLLRGYKAIDIQNCKVDGEKIVMRLGGLALVTALSTRWPKSLAW
jgi:hypothetical protein